MTITVRPLDGPIGAAIEGVDTRHPLAEDAFSRIHQAMVDHVAVVVPDLAADIGWLRDFGRRFGPLVPHVLNQYHHPEYSDVSVIARNTRTRESRKTPKPAGAFWHSDLSYEKAPADAIILYATAVPRVGGDTLIANMVLAYDALPASIKERIDGLSATHRYGWNTAGAAPKLTDHQSAAHPDVVHPIVRTHPVSGRKILYANPAYTMRIEGMRRQASDDLLSELFAHAANPAFHYRHRWSRGMLIALDNRAALHAAVDDYTEPRRMLRMIVGCTDRNIVVA